MSVLYRWGIRTKIRKSAFFLFTRIAAHFFHKAFYEAGAYDKTWMNTWWMGTRVYKSPLDLWVYQEILVEKRPDVVVETGTAYGGAALFLANMMDLMDHGEVITIDPVARKVPVHERITYLRGSSVNNSIVEQVLKMIHGKTVMVVLDSDHSMDHVSKELDIYSDLVSVGQYCIVEDTNVNGHPVHKRFGPGPWEAVRVFLDKDPRFQIDRDREKYLFSFNPGGFLLKVAS
jgi:cephalosporin hydroxylase